MSTFSTTYGSSDMSDTGIVPRGTILLNGAGREPPPGTGRPPPASPPAGHNSGKAQAHSFQDDADAVVRLGPVITSFRRIGLAIRDPRCKRHHLRVLYAYMVFLNQKTGTAFPSRRAIAEQEGLQYEVVENALYDLRRWGYIDWEKRAEPDLHKGNLLHYTLPVLRWTEEQLTSAILELRSKLKAEEYTTGDVHKGTCTQGDVPKSTSNVVTRNLLRELVEEEGGADAPADLLGEGGGGATAGQETKADRRKRLLRQEAKEAFTLYVKTAERCGLAVPQSADPWLPNIGARLRDAGGIDGWKRMLAAVENSAFLCGENDRHFAADLDWLVKPKNFEKVLSGKYARRGAAPIRAF